MKRTLLSSTDKHSEILLKNKGKYFQSIIEEPTSSRYCNILFKLTSHVTPERDIKVFYGREKIIPSRKRCDNHQTTSVLLIFSFIQNNRKEGGKRERIVTLF